MIYSPDAARARGLSATELAGAAHMSVAKFASQTWLVATGQQEVVGG